MQLRVLGSSAGGGFPQWNCNCPQCDGVRQGRVRATPRTQSSVAVSADGRDWLLINASPDILTQIRATAQLQPARALRDSGIAAVLLMDAQIDHTAGLLMLRERRSPLPLLATREVLAELEDSLPLTRVLSHYCGVAPHVLPLDGSRFSVPGLPGVVVQALALSSSPPPYSPHRSAPRPGDNIGVLLHNPATGARIFYAPGLGALTPELLELLASCSAVLVDGTFWSADEMQRLGLGTRSAADMGHLPQSGPGGMLEHLARLPASVRKVLIHINNTNPILIEDGAERAALAACGVEVAHDGMTIEF
ncbi:pyrroloquinoline quinone biosynthesis protein PqqB [Melaminivora jejuensis]|uniref:pyrroloquinoline quinone biosynthesis protein PqqB n=2 Tax=Melaminivora jejuensis TaxID=1267217 RepID=UPI001E5BA00F|nr:pyrroloquinoline quinone biosynthesis protein PqqB [Melaminivora jejuensis]UHJ65449.1 pyrroloquinoline quinone biosynthesis protein PqqB [Melaminivora jejuensis]